MEFFGLISFLVQVTLYTVGSFLLVKYAYLTIYYIVYRNELTEIDSKISILKLRLKTRIHQNYKPESEYKSIEGSLGSFLNPLKEQICALSFSDRSDFQLLTKNLAEINEAIKTYQTLHSEQKRDSEQASIVLFPEFESVKKCYNRIFEQDSDTILMIVEIKHLTTEFIAKAEDFNKVFLHEKRFPKISNIPEPIEIYGSFVLEDLYKNYHEDQQLMESIKTVAV